MKISDLVNVYGMSRPEAREFLKDCLDNKRVIRASEKVLAEVQKNTISSKLKGRVQSHVEFKKDFTETKAMIAQAKALIAAVEKKFPGSSLSSSESSEDGWVIIK